FLCFFFQAEDGIRDFHVTGVQTCALPIYHLRAIRRIEYDFRGGACGGGRIHVPIPDAVVVGDDRIIRRLRVGGDFEVVDHRRRRSEERRVGKECRVRWSQGEYRRRRRTLC